MSGGKMAAETKELLRRRRAEMLKARRERNPSPQDFDDGDLAAAVDWVVQELGVGAPGGPHEPLLEGGDVNGVGPFVYLRYAKRMDAFLAQHMAHTAILKKAGPGERLVRVYHYKPIQEVVKFITGGKIPVSWAYGVKYVGWLKASELASWVAYTQGRTDKVRQLLRKAGG